MNTNNKVTIISVKKSNFSKITKENLSNKFIFVCPFSDYLPIKLDDTSNILRIEQLSNNNFWNSTIDKYKEFLTKFDTVSYLGKEISLKSFFNTIGFPVWQFMYLSSRKFTEELQEKKNIRTDVYRHFRIFYWENLIEILHNNNYEIENIISDDYSLNCLSDKYNLPKKNLINSEYKSQNDEPKDDINLQITFDKTIKTNSDTIYLSKFSFRSFKIKGKSYDRYFDKEPNEQNSTVIYYVENHHKENEQESIYNDVKYMEVDKLSLSNYIQYNIWYKFFKLKLNFFKSFLLKDLKNKVNYFPFADEFINLIINDLEHNTKYNYIIYLSIMSLLKENNIRNIKTHHVLNSHGRVLSFAAEKFNIKCIDIQRGLFSIGNFQFLIHEWELPFFKRNPYFNCWGRSSRDQLLLQGIQSEKIELIGCNRFTPVEVIQSDSILIVCDYLDRFKIIDIGCMLSQKYNKKIVIRPHPSFFAEVDEYYRNLLIKNNIDKSLFTLTDIESDIKIHLAKCSLVIGTSTSVLLESVFNNIKTICLTGIIPDIFIPYKEEYKLKNLYFIDYEKIIDYDIDNLISEIKDDDNYYLS